MLPIGMMNRVVGYQRDDNKPPLPSVEQMIGAVEAQIERREQRIERIETSVMEQLAQISTEQLGSLRSIQEEMAADDTNCAARPQLENIRQSVADLRRIHETTSQALEETRKKLIQRIQQHNALRNEKTKLQNQVKSAPVDPGMAFLQEFGGKVSTYTANPQHHRYNTQHSKYEKYERYSGK